MSPRSGIKQGSGNFEPEKRNNLELYLDTSGIVSPINNSSCPNSVSKWRNVNRRLRTLILVDISVKLNIHVNSALLSYDGSVMVPLGSTNSKMDKETKDEQEIIIILIKHNTSRDIKIVRLIPILMCIRPSIEITSTKDMTVDLNVNVRDVLKNDH